VGLINQPPTRIAVLMNQSHTIPFSYLTGGFDKSNPYKNGGLDKSSPYVKKKVGLINQTPTNQSL